MSLTLVADKIKKEITLFFGGYEYFCHWLERPNQDTDFIKMNDFIPNSILIGDTLEDLDDEITKDLPSANAYKKKLELFKNKLNCIDVTFNEEFEDRYNVLMSFKLPSNKLDDELFIETFTTVVKNYKESFKKELELLY